jgi:hypothetical protein
MAMQPITEGDRVAERLDLEVRSVPDSILAMAEGSRLISELALEMASRRAPRVPLESLRSVPPRGGGTPHPGKFLLSHCCTSAG